MSRRQRHTMKTCGRKCYVTCHMHFRCWFIPRKVYYFKIVTTGKLSLWILYFLQAPIVPGYVLYPTYMKMLFCTIMLLDREFEFIFCKFDNRMRLKLTNKQTAEILHFCYDSHIYTSICILHIMYNMYTY